jgi:phospholipid/cholesterol/gamma-HCH transport system substrate-binding protein
MKISNETKVGVLTIAALVVLITGFNFLKGKDIFNRSKRIYAVFDRLGALAKSNDVKINGLTIGTVYDMEETDKNVTGIRVTINLTKNINIPVNSIAYISAPLAGLGSSVVLIEKGDATTYLKDGDQLNTRVDEGLFGGLASEVSPTLMKIRNTLDSLNRVFGNINKLFDAGAKDNLKDAFANLSKATNSLTKLLDPKTSELSNVLRNASSFTDNLKKNNDSITAVISNAKQFTEKLSKLNLEQTMNTLESAISQLKTTIAKLSSNDGTLGALINDKKLYNKMNDVVLSAEILLDDLRAHPKRYVNISLFGKKDKGGALTSPSIKDSLPR